MPTRKQHEAGEPMNGTALRVVENAAIGDQEQARDPLEMSLARIHGRFGQIALANSPWFGGIAIQGDFLNRNVQLHPSIMRRVVIALEGRNPRHGVTAKELRLTFDLLGPEEAPEVESLSRHLGEIFEGSAEFGVFRDEHARNIDTEEADGSVGAEVIPLVQTETANSARTR